MINGVCSDTLAIGQEDEFTNLWQHPNRTFQVCMHEEAAFGIPLKATCALQSQHPSEIGGVLLGIFDPNSLPLRVTILAAEFVSCEGALYNSTASDLRNLATALHSKHAGNLVPIGYFRSHLRDKLQLSDQDKEFMQQHFPQSNGIAMIVQPFGIGVCMAGFFLQQNGHFSADQTDFEVPMLVPDESLQSALREHEQKQKDERIREQEWEQTYTTGDAIAQTALASRHGRRVQFTSKSVSESERVSRDTKASYPPHWFRPAVKAGGILVLFMGLGAFTYTNWGQRSFKKRMETPKLPEIGLLVERRAGGQLDLTWNRELASQLTVLDGELTITDDKRRVIYMDSSQLRSAKLTYFPNGTDVDFHLEVRLDDRHSIAESMKVLLPSETLSASESGSQNLVMKRSGTQVLTISGNSASPPKRLQRAYQDTNELVSQSQNAAATQPAELNTPLKDLATQNASLRSRIEKSAPTTAFEPPPNIDGPLDVPATQLVQMLAVPLPVPIPLPNVPLPSSRSTIPTESKVDTKQPRLTGYIAPQPIRKVSPNPRFFASYAFTGKKTVEVVVTIDEAGRVANARAANPTDLLGQVCVAAAKQWTFQPALLHGKQIPVTYSIVFHFNF